MSWPIRSLRPSRSSLRRPTAFGHVSGERKARDVGGPAESEEAEN